MYNALCESPLDMDINELASYLANVFRGIAVQARDGKSRQHLLIWAGSQSVCRQKLPASSRCPKGWDGKLISSHIRLGDLSPTESWGNSSQNGLQNMRVIGDTELIWNRQQ
jgi:hypothetical protein